MPGPKGDIGHAEIEIGRSRIMLADEHPEIDFLSPAARCGTTVTIHLYVPDADRIMQRATEAGGTVVQPMKDQFYGGARSLRPRLAPRHAQGGPLHGRAEEARRAGRQGSGREARVEIDVIADPGRLRQLDLAALMGRASLAVAAHLPLADLLRSSHDAERKEAFVRSTERFYTCHYQGVSHAEWPNDKHE
jgi:hypothetical protein